MATTYFSRSGLSTDTMGTRLAPVAFDIETTGFSFDETVTAIGFALPLGCRAFFQTGGQAVDADAVERELDKVFDTTIQIEGYRSEGELLRGFSEFVTTQLASNDYLLTAFNGELYNGGFDLPFLRTRFAKRGESWPFTDIPYADLMPLFRNRFNTTIDGATVSDLAGVYDALCDGDLSQQDPFGDSAQAVEAFESGQFDQLVQHNVADILRTAALASLAQRYCGKSDFRLKSLTATVDDPSLTS